MFFLASAMYFSSSVFMLAISSSSNVLRRNASSPLSIRLNGLKSNACMYVSLRFYNQASIELIELCSFATVV
jgi:hypothetical protein